MGNGKRKTLNGQPVDPQTNSLTTNRPSKPEGTNQVGIDREPKIEVRKALYGLVINLVPTSTDTSEWSESVLVDVLMRDNIIEDILKEFAEQAVSGSIELGVDGNSKSKHAFQDKSIPQIGLGVAGPVLAKRFKENKHVKLLSDEVGKAFGVFGKDVVCAFVNRDFTKIMIYVASAAAVGTGVVGLVSAIESSENDTAASVVSWLANQVPEVLYEVGDVKLKDVGDANLKIGHTDLEWTPSKGKWKKSAFVAGEWLVQKDLKLKGKLELIGSQNGANLKLQTGAVYNLGNIVLDSVEGRGTADTDGRYELLLQFNKKITQGDGNKLEAFLGAKYSGQYRGDPQRDQIQGFSGLAGLKLTFGSDK